jgi:hypothetical protein
MTQPSHEAVCWHLMCLSITCPPLLDSHRSLHSWLPAARLPLSATGRKVLAPQLDYALLITAIQIRLAMEPMQWNLCNMPWGEKAAHLGVLGGRPCRNQSAAAAPPTAQHPARKQTTNNSTRCIEAEAPRSLQWECVVGASDGPVVSTVGLWHCGKTMGRQGGCSGSLWGEIVGGASDGSWRLYCRKPLCEAVALWKCSSSRHPGIVQKHPSALSTA